MPAARTRTRMNARLGRVLIRRQDALRWMHGRYGGGTTDPRINRTAPEVADLTSSFFVSDGDLNRVDIAAGSLGLHDEVAESGRIPLQRPLLPRSTRVVPALVRIVDLVDAA